ncbi:MAG: polysaccharide deacetylase family protein [Bdellovibrionota bacterium]
MCAIRSTLTFVLHGIFDAPTHVWHLPVDSFAQLWRHLEPSLSGADASRRVFLTFDDGLVGSYDSFMRIAGDSGVRATWFVVSDRVGSSEKFIGWSGLRKLLADGHAIGSHSKTHRSLFNLSDSALRSELKESKARMEDELGVPCPQFAAPFGHVDRRIVDVARESGHEEIYSTVPGWDMFRTPYRRRTTISQSTTVHEIVELLANPAEERHRQHIAVVFDDNVSKANLETIAAADHVVCCSDAALRLCAQYAIPAVVINADRSSKLDDLTEAAGAALSLPTAQIVVHRIEQ